MDVIKAITNCDGCNQRHYCEAPKRSRDEPLKCNKEGHGNQPQSHKVALPTNATRASWEHCEYHNNTHPATTIIVTGASIATMQPQWTQEGDTQCGKPQADWVNSCPRSPTTNMGSTTKHTKKNSQAKQKNDAVMTRMPRVTRDDCWTSRKSSCLAEPVTPSLVTTEQARATTTKTTILLVIQRWRGCSLFNALAWPQNFKLSPKRKKYFGWLLTRRMPRLKARCKNLVA